MGQNRRQFIQNSAFLIGGLSLSPQERLFQSLLPDPGKRTLVRSNVGYYTERGGTIAYYRKGDNTIIVDTQFPDQSKNLLESFKKEEEFKRIDLLANTHHHGDHTGGNIVFEGLVNTHVAHENARLWQEKSAIKNEREDQQLYPSTTYTNRWSQLVGGERLTMHYFGPAHTSGDSCIHFENANIVHMGDLMFNRRFPYIDRPSGANIQNWIQVLKKAAKTFDKDTIYIFGHAAENYPVTGTAADLKAMGHYLKSLLKYVKKEIKKGTSLEQLKEKTTVIPKAEEWKFGERLRPINLNVAYAELTEG